jgi:hypothetical protein
MADHKGADVHIITRRDHMSGRTFLATVALLTGPLGHAASNDIGFDPAQARLYCDGLADSYQVLDEYRSTYLSRCIADYRDAPPGDEGSDISPHAASY